MATYRSVASRAEAAALAEHLLEPGRSRPVAVVTVPERAGEPYLDVQGLADAVGDVCEVYLVPTGALTWAMSEVLPDRTQVYGGAGRVYPCDLAWATDPYAAPLRFAFAPEEGQRATDLLVRDALQAAGGSTFIGRSAPPRGEPVVGTVRMMVPPSRALVDIGGGSTASLWAERIAPCEIDHLVEVGMTVRGWVVSAARRFDVAPDTRSDPASSFGAYVAGAVVLARVSTLEPGHAGVELLPGVIGKIPRDQITGNPLDALSSLLSVGEVVAARVLAVPTGSSGWSLGLLDVDDDEEPVAAPAILRGGPPWLTPAHIGVIADSKPAAAPPRPRPAPGPPAGVRPTPLLLGKGAASGPAPAPAAPAGEASDGRGQNVAAEVVEGVGTSGSPPSRPAPQPPAERVPYARIEELASALGDLRGQIEELRGVVEHQRLDLVRLRNRLAQAEAAPRAGGHDPAQIEGYRNDLRAKDEELRHLSEQNRDQAAENARQRTSLRQARRHEQQMAKQLRDRGESESAGFADPEAAFRWEVQQEWVRRIPAGEKGDRPLQEYVVGPEFLSTLEGLAGVDRGKVVEVVVDIATGRVHDLPGRQSHRMRTSAAGGSPVRTRDDGAVCWRVSLQVNTPGARRLHYWQPRDGGPPELSSVRHHDDERA